MPQPSVITIGITPEDRERFTALVEEIGTTQKMLLSALLTVPNDTIKHLVEKHTAKVKGDKEARKEAMLALKKVKKLSPDQAAQIRAILGDA